MEQITSYGLAEILGIPSSALRDKIIFKKRVELERQGKLDITENGIKLNVNQVLFLTITAREVDVNRKIELIKNIFKYYELENPVDVSFEEVRISETLQNPKPFDNIYQNKHGI